MISERGNRFHQRRRTTTFKSQNLGGCADDAAKVKGIRGSCYAIRRRLVAHSSLKGNRRLRGLLNCYRSSGRVNRASFAAKIEKSASARASDRLGAGAADEAMQVQVRLN